MTRRRLALMAGLVLLLGVTARFLIGWNSSPPLLAGLPTATWEQVSEALTRRLAKTFPRGTPEQSLVIELRQEGFRSQGPTATFPSGAVSGYRNSYELEQQGLPCKTTFGIYWNADAGARITDIVGQVGGTCL